MKRFSFTLAALRTWRERLEQVALEHYGAALRLENQAKERLLSIQRDLEGIWGRREALLIAGAPAGEVLQVQNYCSVLDDRRQEAEQACDTARQVVQDRLEALLQARREREVVDRFRDHQLERHQRQVQREEQKTLDEIANLRAARLSNRAGCERSLGWS